MADNLKVDVSGLITGGSEIGEQTTVLVTSHRKSMVGLSDSESGWVGSSADALVRMSAAWQRIADRHHAALREQASRVADTARAFHAMDERSASELDKICDQADVARESAVRRL